MPSAAVSERKESERRVGKYGASVSPSNAEYFLKRPLDVAVSLSALVLLSPLFALLAVAIKRDSRGPILYRQRRLGRGERPFPILKFRTMRDGADKSGPAFTTTGDPRITSLGKWLRRLSLDELPQLVNVLRGDMSLIGPRPYAGFELTSFSADQRSRRASVRPGISGLAQSTGRSSLDPQQTMLLDLEYVGRCSLSLDVDVCLRTIRALIRRGEVN